MYAIKQVCTAVAAVSFFGISCLISGTCRKSLRLTSLQAQLLAKGVMHKSPILVMSVPGVGCAQSVGSMTPPSLAENPLVPKAMTSCISRLHTELYGERFFLMTSCISRLQTELYSKQFILLNRLTGLQLAYAQNWLQIRIRVIGL